MNFPSPGTSDSIEQQPPDLHLAQDPRLLRVVALVVARMEGEHTSDEASAPSDGLASAPHREIGGAFTKEEAPLRVEATVAAASMAQVSSMAQHCNATVLERTRHT